MVVDVAGFILHIDARTRWKILTENLFDGLEFTIARVCLDSEMLCYSFIKFIYVNPRHYQSEFN